MQVIKPSRSIRVGKRLRKDCARVIEINNLLIQGQGDDWCPVLDARTLMIRPIRQILLFTLILLCTFLLPQNASAQQVGPTSYVFVEVRDSQGAPIPDARVDFVASNDKVLETEKTRADGSTKFMVLGSMSDGLTLQVSKENYVTSEHVLFFQTAPIGYKSLVGREQFPTSTAPLNDKDDLKTRVTLTKIPLSVDHLAALNLAERRRKFLVAVKRGDRVKLKELLDAGVNANVADEEGVSAIAWAAFSGDAEVIRMLLDSGANVRTTQGLADQALLIYSFEGLKKSQNYEAKRVEEHSQMVSLLLSAGAAINVKSELRGTVLNNLIDHAPYLGQPPHSIDINVVKLVIDSGADVNAADSQGNTPLMLAGEKESVPIIRMLLAANARKTINAQDNRGNTALIRSIKYSGSSAEVVNHLIRYGANLNVANNEGHTALMIAGWRKSTTQAKTLIEEKASINLKDKKGMTALMYACQGFSTDVCALLVQAGARINDRDDKGWTALMYASPRYYNDSGSEVVKFLIGVGADVNAVGNEGETALILAARHHDESAIAYLLKAGADINAKDKLGQTVLMHACQAFTPISVVKLINAGASATINAKDDKGFTALMYAMTRYHAAEDARQLIAAGASLTEVNNEGQTALMLAAQTGNTELVKAILALGADKTINVTDKQGRTVMSYVRPRFGFESVAEIVKALTDAGAKPIENKREN